jgi:hypothetical protein
MDSNHNHCCHDPEEVASGNKSSRVDWLFSISFLLTALLYLYFWLLALSVSVPDWLHTLSHSVFELVNTIWWGGSRSVSL